MRRDEWRDDRVAEMYVDMSNIDKGPRPFFSDLQHPPFYDEHGRRIENWEEEMAKLPEGSEPEGGEPEGDALEKKTAGNDRPAVALD
jgi:hypothetical protein